MGLESGVFEAPRDHMIVPDAVESSLFKCSVLKSLLKSVDLLILFF